MLNQAPLNSGALNAAGSSELKTSYHIAARGAASAFNSFDVINSGQHGVIIRNYNGIVVSGSALLYREFSGVATGLYGLGATTYHIAARGISRLYINYNLKSSGAAILYRSIHGEIARGAYGISGANYTINAGGVYDLGYAAFTAETRGASELNGYVAYVAECRGQSELNGFIPMSIAARGVAAQLRTYTHKMHGLTRIADDALIQFELYQGVDAEPDFNAAPDYIFDTLPFDTPVLAVGHDYNFVLRQRNAWDLQSKNVDQWSVSVDVVGDQSAIMPSDPTEISLSPSAGGSVHVRAQYDYASDGVNQADEWLIYLTNTGIAPDPLLDTPTAIIMRKSDGVAKLNYVSSLYADGVTVKVLVLVRRSADATVSENVIIYSAIATTTGPVQPVGGVLFGKIAGQK